MINDRITATRFYNERGAPHTLDTRTTLNHRDRGAHYVTCS